MNSELTAYITLICTSGVLNLYLCIYVFLKRHNFTKIAQFFIFYTAFITIYCFASAFGLMSTTLEDIKFWTIIQYVGMPFSPPLGLLFIMNYLGYKITRNRYLALFLIPLISLGMVITNDIHHFHYRVFEFDPILGVPFVHQEIGIWYMIHGIYTFSCMFVAFLLVLFSWKETAKSYRGQLIALMCGQLVPMGTAFIYLLGYTPPGVDPVPMVIWLSSLLYLWAIGSSRMFRIMPVAKDSIFNSINDGVIVLDESDRLIEFNQACNRMFPKLNKSMFGRDFEEIWFALSGEAFPLKLEHVANNQELQLTATNNLERTYQIRTSLINHVNKSRGLLIIFTDITELKRLQVKLEHQAYYDELTQIYNRRAFFELCNQEFIEAKKNSVAFTVILMDVDHFKNVNDTYGHPIGDQILVHVAKVCQTQLKERAYFARYGGEEFVFAMKGYSISEGEILANQIRRHIEMHPFMTSEGAISVTISMGVAEVSKKSDETLYQLLNNADKALYKAKQEGRNRVHVHTKLEEVYK